MNFSRIAVAWNLRLTTESNRISSLRHQRCDCLCSATRSRSNISSNRDHKGTLFRRTTQESTLEETTIQTRVQSSTGDELGRTARALSLASEGERGKPIPPTPHFAMTTRPKRGLEMGSITKPLT